MTRLTLFELVHQAGLRVQAPRRVDEHHVGFRLDALAHRLEGDTGRVRAILVRADGLRAHPVSPGLQLVDGRGTERIGRAEHHRLAVADQRPGELADGRGLSRAVDADHEDDRRPPLVALRPQRPARLGVHLGEQFGAEHGPHLLGGLRTLDLHPGPQVRHDLPGRRDADVGRDQDLFDLVPGVVVEPVPGQQAEQRGTEAGLRPRQPRPQPHHPPGRRRRLLEDRRRRRFRGPRDRRGLRPRGGLGAGRIRIGTWPGDRPRSGSGTEVTARAAAPHATGTPRPQQHRPARGEDEHGKHNDEDDVVHNNPESPEPANPGRGPRRQAAATPLSTLQHARSPGPHATPEQIS